MQVGVLVPSHLDHCAFGEGKDGVLDLCNDRVERRGHQMTKTFVLQKGAPVIKFAHYYLLLDLLRVSKKKIRSQFLHVVMLILALTDGFKKENIFNSFGIIISIPVFH